MSQGNIEIIRKIAAAVGRRDTAVFLELSDPAVEWHAALSVVSKGGAYHGHDGVRQYVKDLAEAFQLFEIELDELLGVGNMVLAVGRVHYRGATSGIEQHVPMGWVFKLRAGKVVALRAFPDPEQALEAFGGLEE